MNDWSHFAMWLAVGAFSAGFWLAVFPLVRAVGRRIEQKGVSAARIEELEARLAELEQRGLVSGEVEAQDQRLLELEERVEFAERLLSRRADAGGAMLSGGNE